jgi:hypothetical protein
MEDKDKGLRDLLHHLKNNYLKDKKPEVFKERDDYCKEKLYETVRENVEYFTNHHNKVCTNANMYFQIPISCIGRMKPSELCELTRKFYKAATGVFGLQNDGLTHIVLTDHDNNAYLLSCYSPIGYSVKDYEIMVYNLSGYGCLLSMTIPLKVDKFTPEQIKEFNKLADIVEENKQNEIKSKQRYQELKTYEGTYLFRKYISSGYAHKNVEVEVMNNIPTKISSDEIAKYADDWNYCFGGKINERYKTDEEKALNRDSKIYNVRIHTD